MKQVTVLRLHNLYLNWVTEAYPGLTGAYCGLIELSLTSQHPFSYGPTQSQFLEILKSSPRLRIIRLRNILGGGVFDDRAKESVILDSLEVLHLDHFDYDAIATTLCCISPGFRPMRLTIDFCTSRNPPSPSFEQELAEFLARSDVRRLELRGSQAYDWAGSLISLAHDLDVLALEGIVCDDSLLPVDRSLRRINTLHIAGSSISADVLRQMVEVYSIQAVTFWCCLLLGDSEGDEESIDIYTIGLDANVEILDPYGPRQIEGLQEGARWD